MEDYKSNSHRSKEEQKAAEKKKLDPVVTSKVTRKKNVGRKLSNTFISEDINNVKSYIWLDVLVPAIKKSISDIVTNSIEMLLYGESGRSKSSSSSNNISYRKYYDDRDRDIDERRYSSSRRSVYSYDDVEFRSKSDAERVLDAMSDIIDRYDIVSVADFYELTNEPTNPTDNKYGWVNLSRASVEYYRGSYFIKFPKAMPID